MFNIIIIIIIILIINTLDAFIPTSKQLLMIVSVHSTRSTRTAANIMDRTYRIYLLLVGLMWATAGSGQDITSAGVSLEECDPDMLGFELITGYVFTAPDDLLDSVPGTLMLTDCLEACQANDSCHAVNYETGLCVLFASNADNYPGKPM